MEKPFNPTTQNPTNITTLVVPFAPPTAWYLMDTPNRTRLTSLKRVGQERFGLDYYKSLK